MDIHAALEAALPPGTIVGRDAIESRYLGDWMVKDPAARPAALARPRSTDEVSTILRLCDGARVPVVAQGGRTGLAGGAVPRTGWVILSLERMRAIGDPDRASGTITVEAGAVLEAVQQVAERADMLFPLDIGGRGTCTIGGNISTNAGGNRVLRYGMMRELVLGLEAVLADGTVLSSMNRMLKNNTGYDLKQLFIGAEGTLGVVTRAVLRLSPRPTSQQTALCALADYDAVLRLLALARARLSSSLAAFEVLWPDFYRCGTDGLGARPPLPHGAGAYVLIETMGSDPDGDAHAFEQAIAAAFEGGIIADAVIAASIKERQEIWAIRDSSGEFPRTFWPNVGFDVSLPIGDIGRFIDECRARLDQSFPGVESVWFGHAADSNIHIGIRVPGAAPQPEEEIDRIVYGCVGDFAGSVSAEHGIGLLKKAYLGHSRSPEELAAMHRLKRAFDPGGILNPGKIFD